MIKGLKLKFMQLLGLIPTLGEVTGENLAEDLFRLPFR